jgi:hypothetical protein
MSRDTDLPDLPADNASEGQLGPLDVPCPSCGVFESEPCHRRFIGGERDPHPGRLLMLAGIRPRRGGEPL